MSSHLSHPWHSKCSGKESGLLWDTLYQSGILCARVRGTLHPRGGPCIHRQGPTASLGHNEGQFLREPVSLVILFPVMGLLMLPHWDLNASALHWEGNRVAV